MDNRPFLLLSTARSGSTPFYNVLATYLAKHHGVSAVGEILNANSGFYQEHGNEIVRTPGDRLLSKSNFNKVFSKRVALAKKYHGRIFFKIFPSAFNYETAAWLAEDFRIITSERQNHLEQILSFLVSTSSGRWYEPKGLRIAEGSLIARFEKFQAIERSIFSFQFLKKQLKTEGNLIYEECSLAQPESFLGKIGLRKKLAHGEIKLPEVQNRKPKLKLFSNADQILNWYESSPLKNSFDGR